VAHKKLTLFVNFLLLWSHRVGRDEAYASAANSKDESQATAGVGLAQGKIAKFCDDGCSKISVPALYLLFLDDFGGHWGKTAVILTAFDKRRCDMHFQGMRKSALAEHPCLQEWAR